MSVISGVDLPEAVQIQQARAEARKVFRAQFALAVLENDGLQQLANAGANGAASADAARVRAAEIVLKFVNED